MNAVPASIHPPSRHPHPRPTLLSWSWSTWGPCSMPSSKGSPTCSAAEGSIRIGKQGLHYLHLSLPKCSARPPLAPEQQAQQ